MAMRLLAGIIIGGGIGALMGYFGKCTSGTCPLTENPFRGAVIGALLGFMLSLSFSRKQSEVPERTSKSAPSTADKAEQETVIHVNNEADFKKYVLEAKLPCLADFFSDSCPPCKMLAPTIKTLADKYKEKAVICKVFLDHAEARGLAQQYRITGIPAVLFFDNGKETQRLVGRNSENAYSHILDEMIKKGTEPNDKE